jgi:hypothetical protein
MTAVVVDVRCILGFLPIPTDRCLSDKETRGIGNCDFKGLHNLAFVAVDLDCLDVLVQVLCTVNQAQVKTCFRTVDLDDGAFCSARQVRQQVSCTTLPSMFFS